MVACTGASLMATVLPRPVDLIREVMEMKCRSHSAKLSKAWASPLTSMVSNNLGLDSSESMAPKEELAK